MLCAILRCRVARPTFKPVSSSKSMPMTSIVQVNVNRSVNPQNAAQAALL